MCPADRAFGATVDRIGCLDGVQAGQCVRGAHVISDATILGATALAFPH